jgi:hypothetical protein
VYYPVPGRATLLGGEFLLPLREMPCL